jgi:hypothetical protein
VADLTGRAPHPRKGESAPPNESVVQSLKIRDSICVTAIMQVPPSVIVHYRWVEAFVPPVPSVDLVKGSSRELRVPRTYEKGHR